MHETIKEGYTRISDIASAFAGYGQVPKKVMDYAADRGTLVHKIIYNLMNHLTVPDEMYIFEGKSVKGYLDSWEKFSHDYEIKHQEERFDIDNLKLTGQMDLIGKDCFGVDLIDWKTSKSVNKSWDIQAAGYHEICRVNGIPIDRMLFIRLDKDGGDPEVVEHKANPELFYKAHEMYLRYFKDLTLEMDYE